MNKVEAERVPMKLEPTEPTTKLGSAQQSNKTLLTSCTSTSTIPVNGVALSHVPIDNDNNSPHGPENALNLKKRRSKIKLRACDVNSMMHEGSETATQYPKEIHLTPDMLGAIVRTRMHKTSSSSPKKYSRIRLPTNTTRCGMSSDRCLTVTSGETDKRPTPPNRNPSGDENTMNPHTRTDKVITDTRSAPEVGKAAASRWEAETGKKSWASRTPPRSPSKFRRKAKSTGCLSENECQSSLSGQNEESEKSNKDCLLSPGKSTTIRKAMSAGQLTRRNEDIEVRVSEKVSPLKRLEMQELYTDAQHARFVIRSAREKSKRSSHILEAIMKASPILNKRTLHKTSAAHSAPVKLERKRESGRFSYESSDDELSDSIRSGLSDAVLPVAEFAVGSSENVQKRAPNESRWDERSTLSRSDSFTDIFYSPPQNTHPSKPNPTSSESQAPGKFLQAPCTPLIKERRRTLPTMRGLSPVKGMRNLFSNFKPSPSPRADSVTITRPIGQRSSECLLATDDCSRSGIVVPEVLELHQRGVDRNVSDLSNDEMFSLIEKAGVTDEIMDALLASGLMITKGAIMG